MNYLKTGILLVVLTLVLVFCGQLLGGRQGMIVAFGFAVLMNFGAYWFSDKIVLAIYRAKPVTEQEAPEFYQVVREVIREANIPMPRLYVLPMEAPNAFATGRSPAHAAVAATHGLLRMLSPSELKGVIAHEIAHIKNRDTLIMTVAATIAGAIAMLANMARYAAIFGGRGRSSRDNSGNVIAVLVMTILAPLIAMLIQLAISRTREYSADKGGAGYCHGGLPLANALVKLQNAKRYAKQEASPQTAHLFIINPLSGKGITALFSTHPPIEERVKRLRAM